MGRFVIPLEWPDDHERMDVAGTNGSTGDAPRSVSLFVIDAIHFAGSMWVVDHPPWPWEGN